MYIYFMETNMTKKEKQGIEKNNKLAFNLAVEMLSEYGKNCNKDEEQMDPLLGSYLLVNNLAIGLIFQAEGYESELADILKDAINDAQFAVNKTKEAS